MGYRAENSIQGKFVAVWMEGPFKVFDSKAQKSVTGTSKDYLIQKEDLTFGVLSEKELFLKSILRERVRLNTY